MNIKQIRTLVILGLVIVIGGVVALFYRKTPSLAPNGGVPSTITPGASNEPTNASEDEDRAVRSEETNTKALRPAQQNTALRARALEIINKSIVVKAAVSPESKKQTEAKIAAAIKLIQENYDRDFPWLELAAYRQALGDFDGAIEALDFLSTIRPKEYVSFHNLGVIYGFYLKNYPKSEENFLKSIANNASNFDAYSQLVTIYEVYKPERIEPLLFPAIQKNPSNVSFKIMLGKYYANKGKITEAIRYLEEALKLNPTNTELKTEIEELKK